jgi:putative heme-binding domain-containing protein
VRPGPDGALYLTDMYRLVIEHPKWIPDAWQKQLGNLRAGENEGRIYRVRPKGVALRPTAPLDGADTKMLIAALESPSGTTRDLAQQQLTWRGDKAATSELERLVVSSTRPQTRAQALWTLQTTGALSASVVKRALGDAHAGVRRQAVRLTEGFANREADLLPALTALTQDSDLTVRQQLAYTLGEWKDPAAGVALAKLLRSTEDRFVRAAAMSSALPHAETLIAQLSAGGRSDDPLVIEIAAVTENAKALASILTRISARATGDSAQQFGALALLLDWLQRNNKTLAQLQSAASGETMTLALQSTDEVFAAARKVASDSNASIAKRTAAVKLLGRGRSKQSDDFELLVGLLTPQSPVDLQLAAVSAIGRINRANVAERLLAGWEGYSRSVRTAVLDLVTSRPAWAQVLLDRVEKDPTLLAQIEPGRRVALTQNSNAKLAERATAIFSAAMDQNRQKVIDRYLAAVATTAGDRTKGAQVFSNICSACHKFGDIAGRLIGPDIASVKDRSPGYLVTHILDPNRAVEDRYILYTAATQDGRSLAGMMAGESGNSITLVGLDGAEQMILRSELRSLASTGRSLMPDGLEAAITEQAMADLIAFLGANAAASQVKSP